MTLVLTDRNADQDFDAGWGSVHQTIVPPQVAHTYPIQRADVLTVILPVRLKNVWVIRVQQSCAQRGSSAEKVNVSIPVLKLVVDCTKRVWMDAANARLARQMESANQIPVPM